MDNRPIRPNKNGKYNLNFIDWNNEWERVSEVELKIQNGEEIEDKDEEARVKAYMKKQCEKLGMDINIFTLVKNVDVNKECYVCLSNFDKGKRVRQLPCKHMFCEECILPWFSENYSCPTCKVVLREDNNDEDDNNNNNEDYYY